jgi:hypothetical protein
MEIDIVEVGVWVSRWTLHDGTQRGGREEKRLATAALCTRCEYCTELRNIKEKTR